MAGHSMVRGAQRWRGTPTKGVLGGIRREVYTHQGTQGDIYGGIPHPGRHIWRYTPPWEARIGHKPTLEGIPGWYVPLTVVTRVVCTSHRGYPGGCYTLLYPGGCYTSCYSRVVGVPHCVDTRVVGVPHCVNTRSTTVHILLIVRHHAVSLRPDPHNVVIPGFQ